MVSDMKCNQLIIKKTKNNKIKHEIEKLYLVY